MEPDALRAKYGLKCDHIEYSDPYSETVGLRGYTRVTGYEDKYNLSTAINSKRAGSPDQMSYVTRGRLEAPVLSASNSLRWQKAPLPTVL